MKVVIASDSFKGAASARQACESIRKGILDVVPDANVSIKPMADGGEGTADAMMVAHDGIWLRAIVTGPLMNSPVEAGYAWFESDKTALVEMAAASGMALLKTSDLNPLNTTTYGTGQLIIRSLDRNPERILLAVGGSATVDGGIGAATAMGWRFLDDKGKPVEPCGGALENIHEIVPAQPGLLCDVEVLCDVDNPLTGKSGAAHVFGPQKGATAEMIERLDAGLQHLADLVRKNLGVEIEHVPGAGAAGGLAAGAIAFMNGRLVPGIDTVMSVVGLEREIKDADWVISGEGRFDSQSIRGKVVSGVVKLASKSGVKVAVIAGQVDLSYRESEEFGVDVMLQANKPGESLEESLRRTLENLRKTASEFAERYMFE